MLVILVAAAWLFHEQGMRFGKGEAQLLLVAIGVIAAIVYAVGSRKRGAVPDAASPAASALIESLGRAEEKTRQERNPSYARILEEERLLRELRTLAAKERIPAAALAPVAARVIAIAADEDTYDTGSQLSAGLYAAELLAATGVPAPFAATLRSAAQAPGLKTAIRALLEKALDR